MKHEYCRVQGQSMVLKSDVRAFTGRLLILLGVLTAWHPVRAQENATSSLSDLKIVVVRGEGFSNNLKKRVAREPIVEVRDRNNKPVAGATVTFALPGAGPGGT